MSGIEHALEQVATEMAQMKDRGEVATYIPQLGKADPQRFGMAVVMNDGRIVARKFVGYFDAGATTRLSSYAVVKCAGHLPGPYTIPNVYADIYCVFTNRTPATAMRGFGITGVDFAIEAHMDKVAHEVGLDPIELRILNAYRDGDMKAHRRLAKNTALIECCQVAAEKAKWPLSQAASQASSLRDGGGERGRLPAHTATDQNGLVTGFTAQSYAKKSRATQPSAFWMSWCTESVVLYGAAAVSLMLFAWKTEQVQTRRSGISSRSFRSRSVPMPEPVPPPSECVSRKPCRQSQPSACRRTASSSASMSSAPSV